jgi:hypothetical protein
MKIGDKFIVTTERPYSYILGHNTTRYPEFILLEVIEERNDSKGEFSGEIGTGYIAKGSDNNLWSYNYPRANEGYGDTPWVKYITNEDFVNLSEEEKTKFVDNYMASDVTQFQAPPTPIIVTQFKELKYCEVHQRLYDDRGCFYCKYDFPAIKDECKTNSDKVDMTINKEKYQWLGWY